MDSKHFALVMAGSLLAGCAFDNSGVDPDGGMTADASPPGDTQGPTDGGDPDGSACAGAIDLKLAIDGQAATLVPGAPVKVDVLVGDVVELSTKGSCAAAGPPTYEWQITPDEGKADPAGLDGDALSFYPTLADVYTVDVMVRDGMDNETAAQIEVTAHGWQAIEVAAGNDDVTDIRDLEVSNDDLWIAANAGARRLSLTGAQDEFFSANDGLSSDFIGGNLAAVYYDIYTDNRVWFGSGDSLPAVWRVDLGPPPVSITTPFGAVDALNTSAKVHAIGPDGTDGVMVATDQGLTEAADSLNFSDDVEPQDDIVEAIAVGGGRRWGGNQFLYDLDDVTATAVAPFGGGGDQKIRALVVDETNGELWVGSESKGIARLDNNTGNILAAYDKDNSGLTTNNIRHIQVETSGVHEGDAWVATDDGVAHYVRARDEWVAMDDTYGLTDHLDVKAIAIDEAGGRRAIYAGTVNGVVYIRTP